MTTEKTPRCEPAGFFMLNSRSSRVKRFRLLRSTRVQRGHKLQQRRQVVELLARRRRGSTDKVEYPAVLQSVIGKPLHLPVLVEIDRDHPLVDQPLIHESDRTLGALRDVIEDFAVEGCDGGGRPHHDQHLVLARADRNLLKRPRWKNVTLLKLLAGAAAEHGTDEGNGGGRTHAAPARSQAAPIAA